MTMHTSYVSRPEWRDATVEVFTDVSAALSCGRCKQDISGSWSGVSFTCATLGELVDAVQRHAAECRTLAT